MDSHSATNTFKWLDDPCPCNECAQLRISYAGVSLVAQATSVDAYSYPAVASAVSSVGVALQAMHAEHRPELYLAATTIDGGAGTANMAVSSHLRHERSEKHKFLVCDHCMAHGLICNEASLCEQCRNYGVPCIHRWCAISPTSIEDCTNSKCHYSHMDSIPHVENEPKWIIFKSSLPPHLERGKLPSLRYGPTLDAYTNQEEWVKLLDSRQEHAVKTFVEAVQKGEGTYAKLYIACGCEVK